MLLLLAHSEPACFRKHETSRLSLANLEGEDDDTHRLETVGATIAHMLYELQTQMDVDGDAEANRCSAVAAVSDAHVSGRLDFVVFSVHEAVVYVQRGHHLLNVPESPSDMEAITRSPRGYTERTTALPRHGRQADVSRPCRRSSLTTTPRLGRVRMSTTSSTPPLTLARPLSNSRELDPHVDLLSAAASCAQGQGLLWNNTLTVKHIMFLNEVEPEWKQACLWVCRTANLCRVTAVPVHHTFH